MYQARMNSFNELPKDKRPPRYMWDRPHQLGEYLEHVWDKDEDKKGKDYVDIDFEDID